MDEAPHWQKVHEDPHTHTRVYAITLDTETPLGQRIIHDPLRALIEAGIGVDASWHVQLVVANAHLPTGPLPASPVEPTADSPMVIRRIIATAVLDDATKTAVVTAVRAGIERAEVVRLLYGADDTIG
jgi:hypothetical protein